MATTGDTGDDSGMDSRQLGLVSICLVGLVAAAFLAPVSGANPAGPGESVGGGGAEPSGGDGGGGPGDGEPADGGEPRSGDGDGGGGVFDTGDGEAGPREQRGCYVLTPNEFRPGTEETVTVLVDGDPASGVRVWFNDEFVGRTDSLGRVQATVPYERELNVTVESPTGEPCTFSSGGRDGSSGGLLASGATARQSGSGVLDAVVGTAAARQQDTPNGVNNSTRYDVVSSVALRVEGDRYPGANATLVATVGRVPMANATVSVDGTRVGETDERGRYRLTVPDADQFAVRVSRGEIRGQRTVDIWDLSVGFAPALVLPGDRVAVNVTRNGAPVENATVSLSGQSLGTTAQDGRRGFRLPASVEGTVRASTPMQTATVPLWRAYALTAGLALLLGVLGTTTTAVTGYRRGRESAKRVAAFWTAITALYVGRVVGDLQGLALVAGGLALVALYRYRRVVRSGGATTAGLLAGFLEWCRQRVLGVVGLLESAADWVAVAVGRLWAWLRSLPRSLSGLASRLGGWLRRMPGRLLASLRSLPLRAVAAVCLALAVVATATVALGPAGFLGSVALVAVVAVLWWYSRRETADSSTEGTTTVQHGSDVTGEADSAPTLRLLWRRLARWVLPSTWRTRTPTEVSRAAVEKGLPRAPVEALADAFRDVEYGGRSEESLREQARAAFDRLDYERERDEGEAER